MKGRESTVDGRIALSNVSGLRGTIGAAGLARVGVLLVSFALVTFSTRLILDKSAPGEFGVIMLVSTMALLFPFADLGLGAAVMSEVGSRNLDDNRGPEIRDLLGRINRILTVVASLVCLIGLAFLVLGIWPILLDLRAGNRDLELAATATVILFGINIRLGVGFRTLIGVGKTHIAILCQLATPIVTILVALTVAAGWAPPEIFAVAYTSGLLLANVLMCALASKTLRMSVLSLKRAAVALPTVPLLGTSLPMMAISVATPLSLQSDRFVLAHFSSAGALTVYALVYQLYGPAYNVLIAAATPLWPHFARLRNSGHGQSQWKQLTFGFAGAGLAVGGAVVGLAPIYLRLVGGSFTMAVLATACAAGCLIFAQSTLLTSSMSLTTANGLRVQAVLATAAAIASIIGSVLLAGPWGAPGPLVASAASVLVIQTLPLILWRRRLSGDEY